MTTSIGASERTDLEPIELFRRGAGKENLRVIDADWYQEQMGLLIALVWNDQFN